MASGSGRVVQFWGGRQRKREIEHQGSSLLSAVGCQNKHHAHIFFLLSQSVPTTTTKSGRVCSVDSPQRQRLIMTCCNIGMDSFYPGQALRVCLAAEREAFVSPRARLSSERGQQTFWRMDSLSYSTTRLVCVGRSFCKMSHFTIPFSRITRLSPW